MKNFSFALHTVAASVIAALAVACSSDEGVAEKQPGVKETVTLTAYQPGDEAGTRMGFDKQGDAYWHAADKIGVWSSTDNKFSEFSLSDGAGEATATFTGETTDPKDQYAVYPYNENHKLSGSSLTYYLPDSYTYTSVDQTFFPEGNNGNSFCAPMYGQVSDNNTVSFKHLGGVLCIKIDKMPAETGTVKVTEATNKLCGEFSATLTETDPEIKTAAASGENFAVTFTYSGATKDAVGVFYLPVATGNYNLTIEVSGGRKLSTATSSVKIMRTSLQVVNVTTSYVAVDNSKTINGHYFVDLGLPSGLLWAETNIGAETAADDGNYYAWGETEPQSSNTYDAVSYKYCSCPDGNKSCYDASHYTKYNSTDNKATLESSDDAAYINWKSPCRMPTKEDFEELTNTANCTWTWTSKTNSSNETINGYLVQSKTNNNYIFFPASGNRNEGKSITHGSRGCYWSSTRGDYYIDYAYSIFFYSDKFYVYSSHNRYRGDSVRPVAEP